MGKIVLSLEEDLKKGKEISDWFRKEVSLDRKQEYEMFKHMLINQFTK